MTCVDRIRWTSAARTHVGLVRAINEDASLDRPQRGLWAVADGMGGHDAGDLASRMVIAAVEGISPCISLPRFVAEARQRLQAVNHQLRLEAASRHVHIIGSTVVALLACEASCTYLWAGDSRIYLYRDGRLRLLSHDHSQIEELKLRGVLTAADEAAHPGHNIITRAVGALDHLELDEGSMAVADGDIFLLCSDGVSKPVSEEDICSALAAGDCDHAADTLIELALKAGGRDNITAVVVRADDLYASDLTLVNPAL
jgi:protein phosphatase